MRVVFRSRLRIASGARVEHLFKSDGLQCDIDLPLPKERRLNRIHNYG